MYIIRYNKRKNARTEVLAIYQPTPEKQVQNFIWISSYLVMLSSRSLKVLDLLSAIAFIISR